MADMDSSTKNGLLNGTHSPLKLKITNEQLPKIVPATTSKPVKTKKKKHRDKSDLGDNFIAPDGGWGWLVAVAGGVSILTTFAMAQQFGIIFRERMANLGITSSQLTSIINIQIAVSAITGLLNGPLFRRYTYRQVALVGSFLTFLGLFLCVFADSFMFYVASFSVIYGFGRGLTVSASSLAVNTYFKQKRRTATAYQFGVAGLGPIVCPYLATFLLYVYGVQGTVLIFSSLSLHTIACSMLYQPVMWHVKKQPEDAELADQYFTDEDDDIIEQVAEPETPVLPRANDGWFGSRASLNTLTQRNRRNTLERRDSAIAQVQEMQRLTGREALPNGKQRTFSTSHSIKEERENENSNGNGNGNGYENQNEDYAHTYEDEYENKKHQELAIPSQSEMVALREKTKAELVADEDEERKRLPFYKKIVIFFDLDLLRDFTYVNLSLGLTLINFVEINFAILTPFILSDFGFENSQIAFAMSLLGFCDLVVRFTIPLITAKAKLSNKTFFIIGIIGMCIGRAFLAFTRDFYCMVAIFLWLGLNKAFRTVFWSLIIPGYVPLKRLPAAAGLQLLMSGIFSLACGPIIGLIRDGTNYAVTLNVLNGICIFAIVMWLLESFVRKRQLNSKPIADDMK